MSDAPPCDKRRYTSRKDVHLANQKNGHRIRAYWCYDCRAWHGTKHEG